MPPEYIVSFEERDTFSNMLLALNEADRSIASLIARRIIREPTKKMTPDSIIAFLASKPYLFPQEVGLFVLQQMINHHVLLVILTKGDRPYTSQTYLRLA